MAKTIGTPLGSAPLIPVMLIMVGGYLAWFGVHYWRTDTKWPSDPVKSVITGKGVPAASKPPTVQAELAAALSSATPETATPNKTTPSGGSNNPVPNTGSPQSILQQTAIQFGWGAQWLALHSLEMGEAGFDPHAKNPSGAYGLAQALGHGNGAATQGTESNEYGGFGLSDAQAKQANSGDPATQSLWMCNYIKAVYTDPNNAWAKWQSRNPHWY